MGWLVHELECAACRLQASASKRQRVDLISAEEVLERIFNNEDSAEGMDSGEESDLDRQLENETGKSR